MMDTNENKTVGQGHLDARTRGGPAVRLEARLPPSRRHPEGAPRCQAVTARDGPPRQCRRKARDGFRTCSHHGAGSRRREILGTRKNPGLVNLRHGRRASATTLQQLFTDHPELQALYDKHLNDEQLLDMRPVLAQVKAFGEWLVTCTAASTMTDAEFAARAIQSLRQVMGTAHDLLRIEEKLGPITHAELRRVMDGFADTIRTFVPAERHAEAIAHFRKRAIEGG